MRNNRTVYERVRAKSWYGNGLPTLGGLRLTSARTDPSGPLALQIVRNDREQAESSIPCVVLIQVIALEEHMVQQGKRLGSKILSRFREGLFGIHHRLASRMDPLQILTPFHLRGSADHVENNRHHADKSHLALTTQGLRSRSRRTAKFRTVEKLSRQCTEPLGFFHNNPSQRSVPNWAISVTRWCMRAWT